MNYRKLYEQKCNIKIPNDYEIHHIDFNRKNNDIMNLVMLPKNLHNAYHSTLEKYKALSYKPNIELQSSMDFGYLINKYILDNDIDIIRDFIDIWYQCVEYVDLRNYYLKLTPYKPELRGEWYGSNKS